MKIFIMVWLVATFAVFLFRYIADYKLKRSIKETIKFTFISGVIALFCLIPLYFFNNLQGL